jgi:hypothetical protein
MARAGPVRIKFSDFNVSILRQSRSHESELSTFLLGRLMIFQDYQSHAAVRGSGIENSRPTGSLYLKLEGAAIGAGAGAATGRAVQAARLARK